jgi:hypothetical protein
MIMKKLTLATLAALGMTAAAMAQQPSQQPGQRSTQPSTQQPRQTPSQSPSTRDTTPAPRGGDRTEQTSFETADRNGDGRVNREEANAIDGFDFSRADTNNDAALTRQEFMAAMSTSTPRDGAGGSASSRSGSSSSQSGSTAQSSGSSRSGATAQSQGGSRDQAGSRDQGGSRSGDQGAGSSRGATAQVTFDTADKDKDGKVSREEASDIRGLNFSTADVNDDASLSRQEFQTAMAGIQPRG